MTTWEMAFWNPPPGASVSSGVISVTSPSYTSLFSFMRRPAADSIELKICLSLSDDEMRLGVVSWHHQCSSSAAPQFSRVWAAHRHGLSSAHQWEP